MVTICLVFTVTAYLNYEIIHSSYKICLFFVHIWQATYEAMGYYMGVNQRKEIFNMKNMKEMKKYFNEVLDFYDGFYNADGFCGFKI